MDFEIMMKSIYIFITIIVSTFSTNVCKQHSIYMTGSEKLQVFADAAQTIELFFPIQLGKNFTQTIITRNTPLGINIKTDTFERNIFSGESVLVKPPMSYEILGITNKIQAVEADCPQGCYLENNQCLEQTCYCENGLPQTGINCPSEPTCISTCLGVECTHICLSDPCCRIEPNPEQYCKSCNNDQFTIQNNVCVCTNPEEGKCDCYGSVVDCNNVCNGTAVLDACGVCNGNGTLDACGMCNGPGDIYECGCHDISEGKCNCQNHTLDACGVCNGNGTLDACGICNGPGDIYECGCHDIPEGKCNCQNHTLDACGVCNGPGDIYGCGCYDVLPGKCNCQNHTLDTCGICNGPGDIYECGCHDLIESHCNCQNHSLDVCGVCDGSGPDACGICGGPGAIYECGCRNITEGKCDCQDNILDACGICNGPGDIYECGCYDILSGKCNCINQTMDTCGICGGPGKDQECGCVSKIDAKDCDCFGNRGDVCLVCNGPGAIYECGCQNISKGKCDCQNNTLDACGVCGGPGDIYECGCYDIPDGECDCYGTLPTPCGCGVPCPIKGCMLKDACNFNSFASIPDDSCAVIDSCGVCGGHCVFYSFIVFIFVMLFLTLFYICCNTKNDRQQRIFLQQQSLKKKFLKFFCFSKTFS
jgi:hypothetical protein